jgi:hypothetical protein
VPAERHGAGLAHGRPNTESGHYALARLKLTMTRGGGGYNKQHSIRF